MSVAAAAMDLVERGFAPVPIVAGTKRPPGRGWRQLMCVQPERAEVEAAFDRWPGAGVGVITGEASDLIILDVDPRNGGDATLERLSARLGLLPEPTVESGGGGRHWWAPLVDMMPSVVSLGPGLEVLGCGHVALVPPTVHPNGRAYRWADGPARHPLPASWEEFLRRAADRTRDRRVRQGDHLAAWPCSPEPPLPRDTQDDSFVLRADLMERWRAAAACVGIDGLIDWSRPGWQNVPCPFHDDHTPSLSLKAQGGLWRCWSTRCDFTLADLGPFGACWRIVDLEEAAVAAGRRPRRPRGERAAPRCPQPTPRRGPDGRWVPGPCGRLRCPVCGPLRRRQQADDLARRFESSAEVWVLSLPTTPRPPAPPQDPSIPVMATSPPAWGAVKRRIQRAGGRFVRVPHSASVTVVTDIELPGADVVRHVRGLLRSLLAGVEYGTRVTTDQGFVNQEEA